MKRLVTIKQLTQRGQGIEKGTKIPGSKILRRFVILISFVSCLYHASAQNIFADTIRKKLTLYKDDTTRSLLLSQMSYYLRYTNMDSALDYAWRAVRLAQQLHYPLCEAHTLADLGLVYRDKGELPKALGLEYKALEIAEKHNYLVEEGNSSRRIGLLYYDSNDLHGAIDYYLFEKAVCLRRIGLVHYDLSEYSKSIDYFMQAVDYDQKVGNNRGIAYCYQCISMAYIDLKLPDSAWEFIQKAGEKLSYIKDFEADFFLWRGSAFLLKGNKESALADWMSGLRSAFNIGYYRSAAVIYNKMGGMFRQMNLPDSSIIYAKLGLQYAKMASNEKEILSASKLLFDLYDSLNKPAEALRYLKIASIAEDSLLGAGNIKNLQEIVARENARQTEIQADRASYQSRLRQIMLATGMGALLIIAAILYRNNRKKQKTNTILANQKAEIQEALTKLKSTQSQLVQAEKMASLGELTAGIAHEIQNPLNFVNNFSEVNAELLTEMREEIKKGNMAEADRIASDIEANERKISHHGSRADGIVKNMVLHARGSVGQKEPTNINALAEEYLRLSYHAMRAKDKSFHAELKTDFDDTIGKIEIIPQDIGRVLVNLYNNSFYALKEKAQHSANVYEPQVSVTTKKANGIVQITVKDNGNGIPEKIRQKIFQPFFTTKPAGQGTGLGLSLSFDIVKAHGGEITVKIENEGSEFLIQLPINKES
jgi:signal transduction histidine kinase